MQHRAFIVAMALLAGFAAWPARAQSPVPGPVNSTDPLARTAPLSLQTQLGAIPLVSPRAAAQAARVRMVQLSQLDKDGAPAGEARAIACPETGCQQMVSLVVGDVPQAFLADIQFVSHGAYVTLQPRSVATAQIVEFRKGRPGPVFIRGSADAVLEDRIAYVTTPSATLRRLDTAADGQTLASGNVYARKREPDLVLKVEIEPAKARE